jgi:hypothetical protein
MGFASAIATIVILGSRAGASARTVTVMASAHRNLIQAMLGEQNPNPPGTKVVRGVGVPSGIDNLLTKEDQEWIQRNLRLTDDM